MFAHGERQKKMSPKKFSPQGLSHSEAAARLKIHGYNELPAVKKRTLFPMLLEIVREPMFVLLLSAGLIYLALGDADDALMLLGFVLITMAITIFQERKAERVLESLRDLSSPRALVIREGEQIRISGREVVIGDLMVLEEGDRVAADGILLETHDLLLDESLLTGESAAIAKDAQDTGGGEGIRHIFSGSMIVQGGGLARVSATGTHAEVGKIGRAMMDIAPEKSPLQQEIGRLVKRFAVFGLGLSFLVFLLFGWFRQDWLGGILAGITLAMSVLPEEFTVILTVFMALGAWRISRNRVLTRHTPVIEALGSASVLCVDKTGTLTENCMALKLVAADDMLFDAAEATPPPRNGKIAETIRYAVLASEIAPFDPMEKAFHRSFAGLHEENAGMHSAWSLVHEYPLSNSLPAMVHVWQPPNADEYVIAAKGAPEAITVLCSLEPAEAAAVLEQAKRIAGQGMRVLAVAKASYTQSDLESCGGWPRMPQNFRFAWLGLVGLADPLRPTVPKAIVECRRAGIRVIMITGDHPATAQAIAEQAGLPYERIMTGAQLAAMEAVQLREAAASVHVFARVRPEQKLKLVNALKQHGEVVAMTGDGVNDAPALKAAHIGISMGARGTDVAREASSLVLLDDDFSSIVAAVRLGRRIYENLRKAMTYVVAVHLPIAGMVILPLLLGTPLAFAPIHIVFLELIINPACALVFETEQEERDIMQRPPRRMESRLFDRSNVLLALLQGVGLLTATALLFFLGLRDGLQENAARALAFTCLVAGNLTLIVASRSMRQNAFALLRRPNPAQWWILSLTAAALWVVLYVPELRKIFHFARIEHASFAIAAACGGAMLIWFELLKFGFKDRLPA